MDELIMASLRGRTSPEEEDALRRWRSEEPSNEERYGAIAWIWRASERIEDASLPPPPTAASIIRTVEELEAAPAPASTGRSILTVQKGSQRWRRVAIPVALAASFAGGLFATGYWGGSATFQAGEIKADSEGRVTLSLNDGSVVRVTPGSSLRFEASKKTQRIVWLDGLAFFSVAPQVDHEFVVRTEMGEVVVHGTRFQVTSELEALEVLVVEGEVAVKSGVEERAVSGGHVAHVQAGGPLSVAAADRVSERLGWMGSFLVFQATPLHDAVREVEARFGVPVQVLDSAPLDRSITATFHDESFRTVMDVICRATAVDCIVTDSLVVIRGSR